MFVRRFAIIVALSLLLVLLAFTDLSLGAVRISFSQFYNAFFEPSATESTISAIIFNFRIPKILTAILAGIALSVSGMQMQTLFRNPLAGPDVLGLNSGASLGMALLILGISPVFSQEMFAVFGNWALIISACLGAGIVLIIIISISSRIKNIMTILILGVMFSSATSALVSILQYFSQAGLLKAFITWTMGSIGGVTRSQLSVMTPGIILGLLLAFFSTRNLNAMVLGENYAQTMGVNLKKTRTIIFLSSSILAGSVTAFCGPIGFIGIAVPHFCRIWMKTANHLHLLFANILLGANAMLLSDILAQLPLKQGILPINSITALLGIPLVIWLIFKQNISTI